MLEDKPNWLDALNEQIGEDKVSIKESCLKDFSHDETEDISKFPEVVVRPENSGDISQYLKSHLNTRFLSHLLLQEQAFPVDQYQFLVEYH